MNWKLILIAIAGLIVYLWLRNRKRIDRTLAPLKEFAAECDAEIADYDAWENTIVGIGNKEPNTLFFIRSTPNGVYREKISLTEVSQCRMSKMEHRVTYKKEYVNVIEQITLDFSFKDHRPELLLEFYNSDYNNLTLTGELQLAKKWARVVSDQVMVRKEKKLKTLEKKIQKVPIPRIATKAVVSPRPGKMKRPLEKGHPVF